MAVLITNAENHKALVVARSLGNKGIKVYCSSSEKFAPTFFSKYSKKNFMYADPQENPQQFLNDIINIVKRYKPTVLMPVNLTEILLIAQNIKEFPSFVKFPFMDYKTIAEINDKLTLYKTAKSLNIRIPKTYEVKNKEELFFLTKELKYPIVIKLRSGTGSKGISYVYDKNELMEKFMHTVSLYNLDSNNYPLIQEYVSGEGYGVSVLFDRGKLKAFFTHARVREFPITGGPGTCRKSVRNIKIEKVTEQIFSYLKWHGIAMAEFKYNSKTEEDYLIEINPRIWGSINQAICSGIDFPYLLYKMALGESFPEIKEYKMDKRTRFFFKDICAIVSYIKKTKNLKLLLEIIKINISDDVLSIGDPLPSLFFIYRAFKEGILERILNNN